MSDYHHAVRAVVVDKRSQTGAVSATLTGDLGLKVRLATDIAGHDEQTLAAEIEKVVLACWEERVTTMREIAQRKSTRQTPVPTDVARLEDEFLAEIEGHECTGVSSQGYVEASVYGDGDLVIQFQENAVRRTDVSIVTLEKEINEAISAAKTFFVLEAKKSMETYRARLPLL